MKSLKLIYSNNRQINDLLKLFIENLGFEPALMSVSVKGEEPIVQQDYDRQYLDAKISSFSRIDLYDRDYNDSNEFSRATFELSRFSNIYISWLNKDFSFLISNNTIYSFLKYENFFFGYLFDTNDVSFQSTVDIDIFKLTYPNRPYRKTKDANGNLVVDVMQNYGRRITDPSISLSFIVSPKMWFANEFENIIPLKSLSQYPGSKNITPTLIEVNLFSYNSGPFDESNYLQLKKFWKKFDWDSVVINVSKYIKGDKVGLNKDTEIKNRLFAFFKRNK